MQCKYDTLACKAYKKGGRYFASPGKAILFYNKIILRGE